MTTRSHFRNTAIRKIILAYLRGHGGHGRIKDIHTAILAAGLRCHPRKVTYHMNVLIEEGHVTRVAIGAYWLAAELAQRPERLLSSFPFGTALKGRILHAMVARRITSTGTLGTLLIAQKVITKRKTLYGALLELRRDGWVIPCEYDSMRVAAKVYEHVGMVPRNEDEDVALRLGTFMRQRILEHLRARGPTKSSVFLHTYGTPPFDRKKRNALGSALRVLMDMDLIEKRSRAVYAALPER